AQALDRALRRRGRLVRERGHRAQSTRVGLPAKRLDARLQRSRVRLRLLEVLAQALLDGHVRRTTDLGIQNRLELFLFSVGLVEVFDEDSVACGEVSHTAALPDEHRLNRRLSTTLTAPSVGVAQLVELLVVVQAVEPMLIG